MIKKLRTLILAIFLVMIAIPLSQDLITRSGLAEPITRTIAEAGFEAAQLELGLMYYYGKGAEQNSEKAFFWFQKLADTHNDQVQNMLGVMYYTGNGVEQDTTKAIEWWKLAIAQNNAEAQFNLADIYRHGLGSKEDIPKARALYEKSAAQGEPHAIKALSRP